MCDKELLETSNTKKKIIDEVQYICTICIWNLKRNMTPMQAVANSLTLDDIPEPLKDLLTL